MTNQIFGTIAALSFAVIGVCLILRPVATLRWFVRDRPQADSDGALVRGRIIGLAFVVIGIGLMAAVWDAPPFPSPQLAAPEPISEKEYTISPFRAIPACLFVIYAFSYQGFRVLRTGQLFANPPSGKVQSALTGSLFLASAAGLVLILARALWRHSGIASSEDPNTPTKLVIGTLLVAVGFLYLLWPTQMLRRTTRLSRRLSDPGALTAIGRFWGAWLVAFGLIL